MYQDRVALAFMDVNPVRPGHVLVIPTAHRAQIWDRDEAESAAVSRRLPALAAALKAATASPAGSAPASPGFDAADALCQALAVRLWRFR